MKGMRSLYCICEQLDWVIKPEKVWYFYLKVISKQQENKKVKTYIYLEFSCLRYKLIGEDIIRLC